MPAGAGLNTGSITRPSSVLGRPHKNTGVSRWKVGGHGLKVELSGAAEGAARVPVRPAVCDLRCRQDGVGGGRHNVTLLWLASFLTSSVCHPSRQIESEGVYTAVSAAD